MRPILPSDEPSGLKLLDTIVESGLANAGCSFSIPGAGVAVELDDLAPVEVDFI